MWRYAIWEAFKDCRANHFGNKKIKSRHGRGLQNSNKGFEGTDEVKLFQRRVGRRRGHDWKLFKNK